MDLMLSLYIRAQALRQAFLYNEEGQDLVEYGLVIVLVCLAATAGMSTLATGINAAMGNIAAKLSTYTQ